MYLQRMIIAVNARRDRNLEASQILQSHKACMPTMKRGNSMGYFAFVEAVVHGAQLAFTASLLAAFGFDHNANRLGQISLLQYTAYRRGYAARTKNSRVLSVSIDVLRMLLKNVV